MGANRPFLQQRDGRLDPKGLIYNPKLPILCNVCCYYFSVFPKRKLEYHPFSTLSSLDSTPTFSSSKIRECDGGLVARLDSNEYYFLYTHPYVPFPSWLRNGGVIRGEHIHSFYLPVQVTAEMNYPLVSQSCIKLFLICPTANVTTSKAVMTSHYGDHTFTTGRTILVSLHVFRDVSTYLNTLNPRIKSHLLFAGIIRSSPFSPR